MPATLRSRFPEIEIEMATKVSAAVKAAAQGVADAAAARVDLGPDPYHIRDEIHVVREGPAEYAVVAGDENTYYGHMLEHGTTKMAPHPFLIPALLEKVPDAAAEVRAVLGEM